MDKGKVEKSTQTKLERNEVKFNTVLSTFMESKSKLMSEMSYAIEDGTVFFVPAFRQLVDVLNSYFRSVSFALTSLGTCLEPPSPTTYDSTQIIPRSESSCSHSVESVDSTHTEICEPSSLVTGKIYKCVDKPTNMKPIQRRWSVNPLPSMLVKPFVFISHRSASLSHLSDYGIDHDRITNYIQDMEVTNSVEDFLSSQPYNQEKDNRETVQLGKLNLDVRHLPQFELKVTTEADAAATAKSPRETEDSVSQNETECKLSQTKPKNIALKDSTNVHDPQSDEFGGDGGAGVTRKTSPVFTNKCHAFDLETQNECGNSVNISKPSPDQEVQGTQENENKHDVKQDVEQDVEQDVQDSDTNTALALPNTVRLRNDLSTRDLPIPAFLQMANAPEEPDMLLLRLPMYNGAYEELGLLGKGGFGRTFLVRHREEDKLYVVKKVVCNDTKEANDALNEAMTLSKFENSRIVGFRDFFLENQDNRFNVCLVMEYIEGGDMEQQIQLRDQRGEGPFPESTVIDWFLQILEAVQHVHEKGLIHRFG